MPLEIKDNLTVGTATVSVYYDSVIGFKSTIIMYDKGIPTSQIKFKDLETLANVLPTFIRDFRNTIAKAINP